ncbi:hypothetical protein LguiA_006389 [Lonicera macranthoides]
MARSHGGAGTEEIEAAGVSGAGGERGGGDSGEFLDHLPEVGGVGSENGCGSSPRGSGTFFGVFGSVWLIGLERFGRSWIG